MKNNHLKAYIYCNFTISVHTTLQVQTLLNTASLGLSFIKNVQVTKDNTPSLPLNDAHLEGFFILNPVQNG
jgi:hypothetical protein